MMTALETVFLLISAYTAAWAVYLVIFPVVAAASKRRATITKERPDVEWPFVAVIIPGRNVAGVIGRCIGSLRDCEYPREKVDIFVVADHCTDDTVEHAHSLGVTVLPRDEGPKGKTYTLAWTFDVLKQKGSSHDMYVVVDATAQVEPAFLTSMADRWHRNENIVANHTFVTPENQTWYGRCLALMFVHRNLQNWSRDQLSISALLTGCGMAFSREYIQRFGWSLAVPKTQGSHPTEDWRHAVRAVEQGYRVGYADGARVSTPLRGSLSEATQQGARWERGRLINAGTYALRLLGRGLLERDRIKVFAALDAMQPPVAILAALALVLAGINYLFDSQNILRGFAGYLPLILVGLYGIIVVVRGRQDGISPSTVFWAPLYVLWRCSAFILAWAFLDRVSISKQRVDSTAPSRTCSPSKIIGSKELDDAAGEAR
jgi:1,2-diacylglycerol 3-beta-glucosyltransferase